LAVDAKTNNSLESLCAYRSAAGAALDRDPLLRTALDRLALSSTNRAD